ncbi:MAG TPA: phosphonate ABC transporter ATP-binding protein [Euzebya sp.]|nr:phosphonate ABC transporter ATP-binding protein [Euzebya sp.]
MTADDTATGAAPDTGAAPPADPVISFRGGQVIYPGGVTAMEALDLDIAPGEFVVVVGLSGAGKSTLIRAINGLVPLTAGSLTVAGRDVTKASRTDLRLLRAEVGMVFQSFNLVKRASVLNNVLIGRLHATPTWRSVLGLYKAADVERAMVALERVEIVDKAYTRAANLSGGQQQRVSIARVLAQEPKVVLADEPVASLDPPTADAVMHDLQRINRDLGITTIVNLHFLDLARRYGDRVIGMRDGRVVFDGPGAEADDAVFEQIYGRSLTTDDVLGVDDPARGHHSEPT